MAAPRNFRETPDKASSSKASSSKGAPPKASKPELQPLDEHLAALLNPALNRNRLPAVENVVPDPPARPGRPRSGPAKKAPAKGKDKATGFAETAQTGFVHAEAAELDPRLAQALGLRPPEDGPAPEGAAADDESSLATDGVSATVDALSRLLTEGNPLFLSLIHI